MIRLFLRAKHWQLFLLLFGLPFIFQFYIMSVMFSDFGVESDATNESFVDVFMLFPIMMIVFVGAFFGWLWSIAMGLQEKISPEIEIKTGKFKVFFFIPLIYILYLSIFMFASFEDPGVWVFAIIVPLHLFSMFCMFYNIYHVARTIKTAELKREVKFGDFIGEFFLLWFYFIGVWILQPRVNKLVKTEDN